MTARISSPNQMKALSFITNQATAPPQAKKAKVRLNKKAVSTAVERMAKARKVKH